MDFSTLLLSGDQKLESLYYLDICIIEDESETYWEKEMQLATEYSNELDNQEPLLTHVGFSCFVGHLATVLQWVRSLLGYASTIHSFVGFIWLSASYSFLKMMCSTSRSIHVQLRWTHVAIKYIVYKRTVPDASFFFLLFITGCILCNFNFLIFEMWDWEEYLNKTEGEYLMQCVSDDRNQYLKNRIRHFLPYACDISVAIKCWQKTKPLKLKINTK